MTKQPGQHMRYYMHALDYWNQDFVDFSEIVIAGITCKKQAMSVKSTKSTKTHTENKMLVPQKGASSLHSIMAWLHNPPGGGWAKEEGLPTQRAAQDGCHPFPSPPISWEGCLSHVAPSLFTNWWQGAEPHNGQPCSQLVARGPLARVMGEGGMVLPQIGP